MANLGAHELKYLKKIHVIETPAPVVPPPSPNTLQGLYNTDLVTEIIGESISVKINGIKVAHIILDEVTNWELQGNKLIIYSEDPQIITLEFISTVEAQAGLVKFETAMNGGVI